MALDLGSKRIGVAISDGDRRVATPLTTVHRSGDRAREHREIRDLVDEWEVELVVVGLPLSLDGSVGPAAAAAIEEAEELRDTISAPVEPYDERLTTVTADRVLREQQLDARARRRVVDMVAAAVLLQSWLDGRAAADPDPPGAP
jgi:putative Holliday junction resolvase